MTKSKKSLWPGFKLRMQLFRIWFMKNILVWVQVICITCFICILTGNITASTPILGKIIYPFFKPLVDEIILTVEAKKIGNLMDFFAIIISILTSVGIFTMKLHRIAQDDIKNNKLKIALIQANLYFNSDGRLVKKTEKMVGKDLDGDGKISDTDEIETAKVGPIRGLFIAIKEFFTIATVDLSGTEEESEEKYEEFLDKENLREREKGSKEIQKTFVKGVKMMTLDSMENELDKKIEAVKDEPTEEKVAKVGFFASMKNKIKAKKKEVAEEPTEEVIVNNVEKDAKVERTERRDSANDVLKNVIKNSDPVVRRAPAAKSAGNANDILAGLKK